MAGNRRAVGGRGVAGRDGGLSSRGRDRPSAGSGGGVGPVAVLELLAGAAGAGVVAADRTPEAGVLAAGLAGGEVLRRRGELVDAGVGIDMMALAELQDVVLRLLVLA